MNSLRLGICAMLLMMATSIAAEAAGTSSAVRGRACGGPEGRACGASSYCSYGEAGACGREGGAGVCVPRPEACKQQFLPVCGCDGRTYGNACMARNGGADVAHTGPCR